MLLSEKHNMKNKILTLVLLLLFADILIILDVPIIREIVWFSILTFIPGLFILHILKLNKIELTKKIVISIGISISFLLFFGLLINVLSLHFGYHRPLSTIFISILLNIIIVISYILSQKINNDPIESISIRNLSIYDKIFMAIPIVFPVLSIIGIDTMNTTNNHNILMIVLFLIPIYIFLIGIYNKQFPKSLYPLTIFLITISLVLISALRSNHIIGVDRHLEYYYFIKTMSSLHWSVEGYSVLDSCLSISILPAMYQSILNMDSEFLYRIYTPIIISISPLIVYIVSKKYFDEFYAFLAAFFYVSQYMFSFPGGRTEIGIFFFLLSILIIFSDDIELPIKKLLTIIFIASCLVSHYSTTYIFFTIMLLSSVTLGIISSHKEYETLFRVNILVLFFTMIFMWYSQITNSTFDTSIFFLKRSLTSLQDLFIEDSRSSTIQSLLFTSNDNSVSFQIEMVLTWIIFLYIAIGVITTIIKYRKMINISGSKQSKYCYLKQKFEIEYIVIMLICLGLLASAVLVPFISTAYDANRIYYVVSAVLAPFFILGGIVLSKYTRTPAYIVILIVLVPYFLCIFGPMHNILGNPRSITLNAEGKFYDMYFVHDQDTSGTKWLKSYGQDKIRIFADFYAKYYLISQAAFSPNTGKLQMISNHQPMEGYIFLRYFNSKNNKLILRDAGSPLFELNNEKQYKDLFAKKSLVYNNGGSEVYI